MYIFIDETGAFQVPARASSVSCVAALVVPEGLAHTLFRRFNSLLRGWTPRGTELKGSQLDERQMAEILKVVRRFDVLLLAVAIDMGLHSDSGISGHKQEQMDRYLAAAQPLSEAARTRVLGLASSTGRLSNQLYVQSVLLTHLVQSTLKATTLYYSQRIPRTLGQFVWRVDAKDRHVTTSENLWRQIVGPALQTFSLSSPLPQIVEADYSWFERFTGSLDEAPAHLKPHVAGLNEQFSCVDIDSVMGDLRFVASHRLTGIQLVDVLASAVRRACNGTLQRAGWQGLGRLMPQAERGRDCVRFLALEDFPNPKSPYDQAVKSWTREAKRMFTGAARHSKAV